MPKEEGGADGAAKVAQAASSHFDREAAAYESSSRYRRLARPRALAVEFLRLTATDRLLDVGCGTGETLRQLAPRVASATGVDVAPKMIEVARRRAQELTNLEFAVAESAELPFHDAAFTAALCTFSFHHFPRPAASAAEIARVLEDGGRLVLADACSDQWRIRIADVLGRRWEPGHVHFYRAEELREILEQAGFIRVTTHQASRSWYMIVSAVKASRDL